MNTADEKLQNIKDQLEKGVAPSRETVRSFLLWFGVSRRGLRVKGFIQSQLDRYDLETSPNFDECYIDGQISIKSKSASEPIEIDNTSQDPTYRINRLEASNNSPFYVSPDQPLSKAVTMMLANDFSHLPVMTNEREVKGIITWKAIGSRLSLNKGGDKVQDFMESAHEVSTNDSFFSAIAKITEHDCVLVRELDKRIVGIVTATDFNEQFRRLAEPFLLVGEIENGIRQLLHGKFTKDELAAIKAPDDSRTIEAISDLTFGEYVRLIEEPERWDKLDLKIDRAEFKERLDKIRMIRNDVMHFDPDGIEESDLKQLREFATFLGKLREIGAI